jgi:hypothetical protein
VADNGKASETTRSASLLLHDTQLITSMVLLLLATASKLSFTAFCLDHVMTCTNCLLDTKSWKLYVV